MDLSRLQQNLEDVRGRIAQAAVRSGRWGADVRLVAVTKRTTADRARALVALGQIDLGENYPQELWSKRAALDNPAVRWHLIGHLQSNKARRSLPLVAMIHSVDSLSLLQTLDVLAGEAPHKPLVCLQVNCSGERAKHGWSPEAILADAEDIADCRHLPVVGLMTMAALDTNAEASRPAFIRLRETRDRLRKRTGLSLPELSMGMSNDYEIGVEEGATLVRVGTALWEGVQT